MRDYPITMLELVSTLEEIAYLEEQISNAWNSLPDSINRYFCENWNNSCHLGKTDRAQAIEELLEDIETYELQGYLEDIDSIAVTNLRETE